LKGSPFLYTETQDGRKIITLINELRVPSLIPDPDINVISASDLSAQGSLDGRFFWLPEASVTHRICCISREQQMSPWKITNHLGFPQTEFLCFFPLFSLFPVGAAFCDIKLQNNPQGYQMEHILATPFPTSPEISKNYCLLCSRTKVPLIVVDATGKV